MKMRARKIKTTDLAIDMYQGRDAEDRKFGYVNGREFGGYFFTWLPTLAATLDSLDGDEIDEPSYDWSDVARKYLATKIGSKFAAVSADVTAEDAASYS